MTRTFAIIRLVVLLVAVCGITAVVLVTHTATGTPLPPAANAGLPQVVNVGATVHLDGSQSNSPNGAALSYAWSFVSVPSGSVAVLTPANAVNPAFVADKFGTWVVQLSVSDGTNSSSAQVIISTSQVPPTAKAGAAQLVSVGATVKLDGSASSDANGDQLSYQWSFVSKPVGSAASVSNASAITPTFIADLAGTYIVQLTVNDGHGNNASDTVTISTSETAPVANAGANQAVAVGSLVQLDGSKSSDADGDPLSFSWSLTSKPAGSSAALVNSTSATPRFTADVAGVYVAQLLVTDSHSNTGAANVVISTSSLAPIAVAGPTQSVPVGATVRLDGTQSGAVGGGTIFFKWSLIAKPSGSAAFLSSPLATPTFVADVPGQYVAQLIVNDSVLTSAPSTVLINAVAPAITVNPSSVNFGTQAVNTTSATAPVTITNSGTANLVITSVLMSGFGVSHFSYSTAAMPVTVAPGNSTTVNVVFAPKSAGIQTATLIINSNTANSPTMVSLQGNAVIGTAPSISLSPGSLSFGNQVVNTTSSASLITITNGGNASLTISGLGFSGQNAADFASSTALPITVLANGGTAIISVTFRPSTQAAESATLNITDNASGSPHTVLVSGTGVAAPSGANIAFSPTSVAFASQCIGATSTPSLITVTNSGTAALNISAASITGANASDFAISSPGSSTVAGNGGSTTVGVTFKPTTSGLRSATLTITDNAIGSPHTVPLSGSGNSCPAGVSLNTTSINFGNQPVNTTSSPQNVVVTNTGAGNIQITSVLLSGFSATEFSYSIPPTPITIAPGAAATITLRFTPTGTGLRNATIIINDNATDSPQMVSLSGSGTTGTAPSISLSPASLSFSSQSVGVTSAASLLTVTNTGTATLTISSLGISGANAGDFAVATAAPINVPANGGTATIGVTFTPSATGGRSATLNITDNAGGSPHTVPLSGTGVSGSAPSISFNPASVNFGNQPTGATSAPVLVTVTNSGTATLQVTGVAISGANPGDFAITTPTSFSVPANGGTATIGVTFTPSLSSARSANLVITDNASGSPHSVALSGTGTVSAPVANVSPASLNFNNQGIGIASAPLPITITNTGSGTLTISSILTSGFNATEFSYSASSTKVNANGGTATINVTFTPAGPGPRSATMIINDNSATSPHFITLSGTGVSPSPAASVSPSSINFGDQAVNATSPAATLTVQNTGSANLVINSLTLSGTNPGDFAFSAALPITVAPNTSAQIGVTFKPAANGARSATLNIFDNATGSPRSVPLSGNGTNPLPGVNPTSLAFGNQIQGTTSNPLAITITNTGSGNLVISSVGISGANPSDFASPPLASPIVVAPGGNAAINVTFTPSLIGAESANLNITDNSASSPHVIPLSGTGAPRPNSLTPSSLDFGNQTVSFPTPPLTVTMSTGSAPATVSALFITGPNASDFSTPTSTPFTISANGSAGINVVFAPSGQGTRTATLSIVSNGGATVQSVPLTGAGVVPGISLSTAGLNFGSQLVGSASLPQTVTITNIGSFTLTISGISFTGTNAGDFSSSTTTPISIPSGGSATVSVVFTPSDTGTRTATLNLADNAVGTPHQVSLTGNGTSVSLPAINIAPPAINFGSQGVGTSQPKALFSITNPGNADLLISSFGVIGSSDFVVNATVPITVPANGGSVSVPVTFNPSGIGFRQATILVNDNAPGSPHLAAVAGTGVTGPAIAINPASVNFSNQASVGSSFVYQVTVSNPGTSNLVISGLAFTGTNASAFTTVTTVPITIAPNGTATIAVGFRPAANGPNSATLSITDNAPGSPHLVPLSGNGVTSQLSITTTPTSFDFGGQLLGTTSSPIQIRATSSLSSVTITSLTLTGENPGDFAVSTATPIALTANASANIAVTFKPMMTGPRSAMLVITHNGTGGPYVVPLYGNGTITAIPLNVSPTSIDFGHVTVNTVGASSITITNPSNASELITGLAISGNDAADFSAAVNLPLSVPAQGTATVNISFRPSKTTAESATLTVTSNASTTSQAVSLAGTGVEVNNNPLPGIALNPTSVNFGNQSVGVPGPATQIGVTNTGNADLVISALSFAGTNAGDFSTTTLTPMTIAPAASANISVAFRAGAIGTRTGTLVISDNTGTPHSVSLTGTGTGVPGPALSITPSSVSFPSQKIGTTSTPIALTLTNIGDTTVQVSSVLLSGFNFSDFSYTFNGSFSIPPNGGTHVINVTFTPTGGGLRSATMIINSNAPTAPNMVSVSGTGTF